MQHQHMSSPLRRSSHNARHHRTRKHRGRSTSNQAGAAVKKHAGQGRGGGVGGVAATISGQFAALRKSASAKKTTHQQRHYRMHSHGRQRLKRDYRWHQNKTVSDERDANQARKRQRFSNSQNGRIVDDQLSPNKRRIRRRTLLSNERYFREQRRLQQKLAQ